MRPFALISLTAGIYCLCESVVTTGVDETVLCWASRIGMFVGAFHGPSWLLYMAAQDRRPPHWWERGLFALGLIIAVVSTIPGGIVTDRVTYHEVGWLGVRYADVQATTFGAIVYGLYCGTLLIPLGAYVRRAIQREPDAASHAMGLAVLAAAATNDALVGAGVVQTPYVLSLGFVVAVLAAGGVLLGRFLQQSRDLEALSRDLESQVSTRSEQLAQARSALFNAEKLAALGRLAAGAAHELNNPCSVVSTNLAYLRHTVVEQGTIPEDADRCLDESIDATSRIARIIRHLVDAGRAGGRARIESAPLRLFEVVNKSVAAAKVGLKTVPAIDVVGDPAVMASGDATLLQQIVVNLTTNAAHAVESRGRHARVRVDVYENGEHAFVDVVDNGTGIAESEVERVFEPFFTTKRPGLGMGLGLAVSLGLARAQNADILIASTSPEGTTMRVRLTKAPRPEVVDG